MKKTFPKVSILIANYNNGKYISDCIDSVICQDYLNKEIIVIDDRSTDNSIKILKKFGNKIITLTNNKKKKSGFINQMNVYNLGVQHSKGELIFFLDSDDLFEKKKIISTVKEYLKNPNKKILFDLPTILENGKKKKIRLKNKIIKTYWPYIPPTSCITMQKKYFKEIFKSIYFNNFDKIWMDFRIGIFAKYIFKEFYIIEKNLTIYRKTYNNVSSKFNYLSRNWWIRRFQAYDYIIFFFKKNNIHFKKNLDFYITQTINFFIK